MKLSARNRTHKKLTAMNVAAIRSVFWDLIKDRAGQSLQRDDHAVERPPDDKCPGRAVPQAADKEGDEQIDNGPEPALSVAAERPVNVCTERTAERDMPSPPEFRYAR